MLKQEDTSLSKKGTVISYYSKEEIECPVCAAKFNREEMYTGGGRLIAGDLTDELQRLYEPSAKYGEIQPLIYHLTVCPSCLYAAFTQDFRIIDSDTAGKLFGETANRKKAVKKILPSVDFTSARTLIEGAASCYLALLCYDSFDTKYSPTIKEAICALRAAWLFKMLGKRFPEENYSYVSKLFYQKALFLYKYALALETSGKEMIAGLKSFGPDVDKNYRYDGVLYLVALLEYRYGQKSDTEARAKQLSASKITIAKLFGLGKSSKARPGPLLEYARALYDRIKEELHEDDD